MDDIKQSANQQQVKSQQRVADYGEVFTGEREVNAMLDLVKQETERIDSRFLEPACGNGNFLVEIIRRKLAVVKARYAKNQLEWERYAVQAVSSIYGIDIQNDNVEECRERLFKIFNDEYSQMFKGDCKDECRRSVAFILRLNILWGDALSLRTPDDKAEPIVFAEWTFPFADSRILRKDYTLDVLLKNQPMEGANLFSDLGDEAFIPLPVKEYPPVHFLNLGAQ